MTGRGRTMPGVDGFRPPPPSFSLTTHNRKVSVPNRSQGTCQRDGHQPWQAPGRRSQSVDLVYELLTDRAWQFAAAVADCKGPLLGRERPIVLAWVGRQPNVQERLEKGGGFPVVQRPPLEVKRRRLAPGELGAIADAPGPAIDHGDGQFDVELNGERRRPVRKRLVGKG